MSLTTIIPLSLTLLLLFTPPSHSALSIPDTATISALYPHGSSFYIGTSSGRVFRISEAGSQLTECSNGLPVQTYMYIQDFVVHRDTLYLASHRGIYRASDILQPVWQPYSTGLSVDQQKMGVAIVSLFGRLCYRTTSETFIRDERTGTWERIGGGTMTTQGSAIIGDRLYMIFGDMGYSNDTGHSWVRVYALFDTDTLFGYRLEWPQLLTTTGNTAFIADYDATILRSVDAGKTWQTVLKTGWAPSSNALASCMFADDSCVIIGYTMRWQDTTVLISRDNGTTWRNTGFPVVSNPVNAVARLGTQIFAGTFRGLYVSNDWGVTWNLFGSASGVRQSPALGTRRMNPHDPGAKYDLRGRHLLTPKASSIYINVTKKRHTVRLAHP